jgi:hypothetical protein
MVYFFVMEEASNRNETEPQARVRGSFRLMPVIVFLLAGYVLGVGPAWKFCDKGFISESTFVSFYAPLLRLSSASPIFRNFGRWYLHEVWKVK